MSQEKEIKAQKKVRVFATGNIIPPEPISQHLEFFSFDSDNIIPWYQNSGNLFPNVILKHYLKATLFSPILQEITAFFTGRGFLSENEDIKTIIDSANENETLRTVFRKAEFNLSLTGNAFLLFAWDDSGTWLKIWNEHGINCRLDKRDFVIVKPNWENSIMDDNKDKEAIPLYPKVKRKANVYYSFKHIKDDVPGFPDYAPPYWIAGLKNSEIPYKTTNWNRSRIDQGFSVSGFYMNPGVNEDDKAAQEGLDKINKDYSGGDNAGKIIMIDSEGKIILNSKILDMDWDKLFVQSKSQLHTDLRFPPSLMGDYQNSGWSKDKGLTDYNLFKPFITDMQAMVLEPIKKTIRDITGFDTSDLEVININPFSDEDFTATKTKEK